MNYFRSNNDSLKYQRLTPSGCKDIAIWKSEFVAKTQFLLRGKKWIVFWSTEVSDDEILAANDTYGSLGRF